LLVAIFVSKIYFQPVAIVLPHHNIVQNVRQNFLQKISHSRPVTNKIILIAPDHFSLNQQQININNENWNLSTGFMIFKELNLNLPVNNSLLKNDHGVYNPLADLKIYFPKATIYPILIGQKVPFLTLESLILNLESVCNVDCLLVTSVDFSHYLPATLAEVHDTHTIKIINNFDFNNISNAEVDSPQSLYILTKYSQSKSANKFNLFAHTNSGFITGNPDTETTTHVFAYYTRGFSALISTNTSVSTPKTLNRAQNQATLGDRFFYGVDEFILDPSLDFVVSTVSTPTQINKSFLPIKDNIFIQGEEKQQLIKNYFDSLPDDQNLTKDYFWGRIIYDRKQSSSAVGN